ncbi:hypothetical protein CFIMG_003413RAa [Ceratocystis fimbriata CBS 114723]|uniref:Myb-like domain-containing protein n=1 Tax=Ceratocystis fimbriata CBS 114723 TaxID=1035309 RepID=A0A2C5XB44_9PEZI|nr:hypothetical protein CFIMG_003413RAa [Ceratocystis fimbriata CBS 114723]
MSRSSNISYSTSQRYNPLPVNRASVAANNNSTTYTQTATRGPYYSPVSEGRTPSAYVQNYDYYEIESSMKHHTADGVNDEFPDDEQDSEDDEEPRRRGKGVKWSAAEDSLLEELRRRRGRWCEIAKKFKGKSANACRKRYERIQQRKAMSEKNDALDKTRVAVAYWEAREEMWKVLESRMPGMKWDKLERMCFEMGENDIRKRWKDATLNKPPTTTSISSSQLPLTDAPMALNMAPAYSQPHTSTHHMESLLVSEPVAHYGPSEVAMLPQSTTYTMPALSSAGYFPPVLSHGQSQHHPHYRTAMHHAQAQNPAYDPDVMGVRHISNSYLGHSGVNDTEFDNQRLPPASDIGINALVNRRSVNM